MLDLRTGRTSMARHTRGAGYVMLLLFAIAVELVVELF